MRFSSAVLGASGGLNALLIVAIAIGVGREFSSDPPAAIKPTVAKVAAKAPQLSAEAWTQIHADKLEDLRDRLEHEGFPQKILAAILSAEIHERFAGRRKALEVSIADAPFWKSQSRSRETQAALREIGKEEWKTLRDLLGPDPYGEIAAGIHRDMPNLPDAKAAQLAVVIAKYEDRRQDIYSSANGIMAMLPEDRRKLDGLELARRQEFAQFLTPQELDAYELRTSRTANDLRYDLYGFSPTEQEFRSIYELKRAFNDQYGIYFQPSSREERQARDTAEESVTHQIEAALGPTRYAEYEKATDYNYRQTSRLVTRLELPADTANQIYALQKDIQKRSASIQSSGTPEERKARLAELAAEAQAKLTATLGTKGYETYKANNIGYWLNSLKSPSGTE